METNTNANGDMYLAQIVNLVDLMKQSFEITAHVGGLIITGTVVPIAEVQQRLDEMAARASGGDLPEHNTDVIQEKSEDEYDVLPTYIHLKNVSFILPTPGNIANPDFPYWRYRIADISGWTIGRANA